jgi:ubiquinone/menaquinone biosynthesis C-methylase UbiE
MSSQREGTPRHWQERRRTAVGRHAKRYDANEVAQYRAIQGLGTLEKDDQDAYLDDLFEIPSIRTMLQPGCKVLDVGAGSGVMTKLLLRLPELEVQALEPSQSMIDALRQDPELSGVRIVQGTCDQPEDVELFPTNSFQAIAVRQVCNGLWDPIKAFQNWYRWLTPQGRVIVIEGTYARDAWRGTWEEEIDDLPLSSTQSLATIPYLLEKAGFEVESVGWMEATNRLPITRTPRYLVTAIKP